MRREKVVGTVCVWVWEGGWIDFEWWDSEGRRRVGASRTRETQVDGDQGVGNYMGGSDGKWDVCHELCKELTKTTAEG